MCFVQVRNVSGAKWREEQRQTVAWAMTHMCDESQEFHGRTVKRRNAFPGSGTWDLVLGTYSTWHGMEAFIFPSRNRKYQDNPSETFQKATLPGCGKSNN
jgi:hypothetical protein